MRIHSWFDHRYMKVKDTQNGVRICMRCSQCQEDLEKLKEVEESLTAENKELKISNIKTVEKQLAEKDD